MFQRANCRTRSHYSHLLFLTALSSRQSPFTVADDKEDCLPQLSLEFRVFLTNVVTDTHTRVSARLVFLRHFRIHQLENAQKKPCPLH